jgi:hypothetical protein
VRLREVALLSLAACSDFGEGLKLCMMHGGCKSPWRLTAVNDSGTELADFPLRVTLGADQLEGVTDPATGLCFYDDLDGGLLPFEVDTFGGGTAEVWVRLPRLEAKTTFWLLPAADAGRADPAAVWSGYELVQHFNAQGTSPVDGGYAATYDGARSAPGVIGDAPRFGPPDGGAQVVSFAGGRRLFDGWSEFTLSWWMYLDYDADPPVDPNFMDKGGPLQLGRMLLPARRLQIDLKYTNNVDTYAQAPAAYRRWFHVVYTYDGSGQRVYVDGVQRGSAQVMGETLQPNSTASFHLGGNDNPITGLIDELHIEARGHDARWISAQHASMSGGLVTIDRP